jgi:hypothetical protein
VPQLVIDPAQHGSRTDLAPVSIFPPGVREFGFVPDVRVCEPGDLILSFSRNPGFIERGIVATQHKIGFSDEHSRWTHASVFLYEDHIVEAIPFAGVVTRSLYLDVPQSVLLVRRFPGLDQDQKYKIALSALRSLGSRYNGMKALRAGVGALLGEWRRPWFNTEGRITICSKVYHDAHVEIHRQMLEGCQLNDLITPAHLRATASLLDVPVPWLAVPK